MQGEGRYHTCFLSIYLSINILDPVRDFVTEGIYNEKCIVPRQSYSKKGSVPDLVTL